MISQTEATKITNPLIKIGWRHNQAKTHILKDWIAICGLKVQYWEEYSLDEHSISEMTNCKNCLKKWNDQL